MSDKENILLDPAEMDKIENMPEIKTVSEEAVSYTHLRAHET